GRSDGRTRARHPPIRRRGRLRSSGAHSRAPPAPGPFRDAGTAGPGPPRRRALRRIPRERRRARLGLPLHRSVPRPGGVRRLRDPERRERRPLVLRDPGPRHRPRRRRRVLPQHRPRPRQHRDRPHLVWPGAATNDGRHRSALPAPAPRLRRPGLPADGVEVQRAQRRLPARRGPPRLHLRGHLLPAHGGQGAQPRHRLVLDPQPRVAPPPGRLRRLARPRQLRPRRAAAPLPGRIVRTVAV
ncbi:MAG: GNAT family acetyltransferase PA5433, partial [uncultured Thermomicrobiales bacterium]